VRKFREQLISFNSLVYSTPADFCKMQKFARKQGRNEQLGLPKQFRFDSGLAYHEYSDLALAYARAFAAFFDILLKQPEN